jgi:hypothetical protein
MAAPFVWFDLAREAAFNSELLWWNPRPAALFVPAAR